MAAQQPGYPQPGQGQFDQYQQPEYGASPQPEHSENASPAQGGPPMSSAAGRKKRQYAGQAYEFGAGGNAALGGQQPVGGAYPGPPAPGYGGYGQQPQQPAYQQPPPPAYSSNQGPGQFGDNLGYGTPPAVGGYQAPGPTYPSHSAPPTSPGMGGITQDMGKMSMGGQQPPAPQHAQRVPQLNQLYPTDLLNQPFNVAELDFPPPPIILPPNVSSPPLTRFELSLQDV